MESMSSVPDSGWRNSGTLAAVLLCLVCAGVFGFAVRVTPLYEDALHYLSLADHLAAGAGYRSSILHFPDLMQPPLYPVLVALFSKLLPSSHAAAIVVCLLAHLLSLGALYRLHGIAWGGRGRLVTVAIGAAHPVVAIGGQLLLEPLFLCLLGWGVYLALRGLQLGKSRHAAAAGALLGLALLTRSEAVLSFAVLCGLGLLWRAPPGVRARWLAGLGAAAALFVVPYGLWMKARLGTFEVLPKVRYNVVYADVAERLAWTPEEERSTERDLRVFFTLMPDQSDFVLNHAFAHPGFDPRGLLPQRAQAGRGAIATRLRSALHVARDIATDSLLRLGGLNPLGLALFVAGLWAGLRRRPPDVLSGGDPAPIEDHGRRLMRATLLVLFAAHLLPALASGLDYTPRFLCASLYFTVPLLGGGTVVVAQRLGRRTGRAPQLLFGLGMALCVCYAACALNFVVTSAGGPVIRERLQSTLRTCAQQVPEGARVMADHSRYGYLRHGASFPVPYVRTQQELLAYIARHRIGYAVFDGRVLGKYPNPVVRGLLDPRNWPLTWVPLAGLFEKKDPIWIVKLQ